MEGSHFSLAEVVAARAAADPSRPALEDGRRRLTYRELDAAGAAIAAELLARGVEPEEPVAVCLPRSWEAVAAFLGALRAGAAYVPVNPEHPPLRQRELVELAGARLGLTANSYGGGLPPELEQLDVHVLTAGGPPGDVPLPPGGDRLAYILFTSGSSGRPKGVEITHGNLICVLRSGTDYVATEDDSVLHLAPLDFDMSASEIWGALLNGGRLVIAPPGRPDPLAVGRLIAERKVSFLNPPAGVFHELVRSALPQLGGLRLIATGADVVSPAAVRELHEAHPAVRVLNGWGPTEATIFATSCEVSGDPGDGPLPIGRPIPGALVYVLDEEGREVPDGEAGELCIGGPGVGRGYRGDPELTAERFAANPFSPGRLYRTGDRGARRADGQLMFGGRLDRQVKISGHRLELGEVEHALASHPGVSAAAVVAVTAAAGRKSLIAHVVPQGRPGPGVAELRAFLGERLPRYMVPASFELAEALPLTERGKLDREALVRAGNGRPGVAEQGHGTTAEIVSGQMAELLELDSVDPDENLFELGGDSLMAISLLGLLRARFGVDLSVDTMFDSPTPAALADRIDLLPAAREDRPPLARRARGREAPLSFAQRRAWLFGQMHPDSIAYQFAATFRFRGELDVEALAGALAELLERHEILRTSFVQREDEPVQLVHDEVALPLEEVDLRGEGADALDRLVRDSVRTRIEPEVAPLVRWTLARHGEREWTLVHVEHHLVHDGWSFTVLTRELSELYSARVEGRTPLLARPELGFGDYALWERELAASAGVAEQIGHWERTLDPAAPPIELPMARPRGAVESFAGSSIRRRMEAPAPAELADAARAEGATTFMASFAAFAALLHRHSGREDLQIGSGLANRGEPAARDLIGMTVNTVVLRLDLGGDPTVAELLRRVRRVALEAYANADAPFDAVVDALAPPRDPSRSPLVNALFSFHDAPRGEHRWAGLDVEMVEALSNGTAKADLNVVAQDAHDGQITFVWEHSDLFDDADVELLAEQHIGLMEQFARRPQARLSELSLAGGEDASAASEPRISPEHVVRGPATPYERGSSIVDVFRDRARERPSAIALDLEGRRLTYAELDARSDRLGRALTAAGARPGSRVGVLARRSLDTYAALLAVLKAGAAYVALDPDWPEARVGELAVDAGLELALAEERLRRRLPPGCEAIALDGPEPDGAAELPAAVSPQAAAYIAYTSGSTGRPKGVEVPHRAVVRLVRGQEWIRLGPEETLLAAAPLAFDASTFEVWGALLNGSRLAVFPPEPLTADALDEVVRRQRVTTLWLPAGLFHRFVDLELDTLRAVDQLVAGGDVLSPAHVRRALESMRPDAVLINGYGPTEATTFTCVHRLEAPGSVDGKAVPIGRPLANTSVVVVDDAGRSLPPGTTGELWIGGDGVASGYLGDPELSARRFVADPLGGGRLYRSGDLARVGAGGAIEFLGRRDRQLKIRGHRVEPAEVERVLAAHPDVAEAAVEPDADAEGQARLVAHYSMRSEGTDWRALRAWVSAQLPAAFVPARWNELERLPLNANGKLDRARLASLAAPAPREARRERRGSGPLVDRLCAAWAAVLELDSVTPDDDFFELGGHSLLAVSLFGEIERRTGVELPLATLFSAPTPAAIAERIAAGGWHESWEPLVPLKPSGDLPPFFCVTAGDGNAVGFAALARRLSERQPFYALQVPGLDGRSRIPDSVEAMAERYLREVRRVAPRGPYLLGGRCLGTKVALEMAQRLVASGEEVPLLAILDDLEGPVAMDFELPGGVPYVEVLSRLRERARREGVALGDVARPDGGAALLDYAREPVAGGIPRLLHHVWLERPEVRTAYPEIADGDGPRLVDWAWEYGREQLDLPEQLLPPPSTPRLARRRRKRRREAGGALHRLGAGAVERIDLASRGRLPGARERREARLRRITRSANAGYRARPYPGRIVHLASAERASELSARRWHDIARGGVEEHVLDSTHRSMLRAPGVAALAARLDRCIATALR